MNGMEMMLSRLLGMKPEEMRAKVNQAVSLMETGARTMAQVQSDLAKIKSHLGITEEDTVNGGIAIADRRNSAGNNHIEL